MYMYMYMYNSLSGFVEFVTSHYLLELNHEYL